ncbi:hypothetical protein [Janthinobacterium sp. HH106]|uniref:hypothetical protein n=1 Tax=Janthinobacterium sp. HH106 TaxID=1537278 RepID=UPI0009F220DB|nr:hypothetical protein [Janthinobacterium sp. HH106]
MAENSIDIVALYGQSHGWKLKPRTVLVEGTSDVSLFELAAGLYLKETGKNILGDMAIVAAGERDRGGVKGVVRELVTLRNLAAGHLSPAGLRVYRIIGLFDSDAAGNKAVSGARDWDTTISEYRDVFRLRPVMPKTGSLDPTALQRATDTQNLPFKGLICELEDLVSPLFMAQFLNAHQTAQTGVTTIAGRVHRELTRDGKSHLVRYCAQHAILESLGALIEVAHALRHYLNLPSLQ